MAADGDRPLVGSRLERREDASLVIGESEYLDDIQRPRTAHLAIKRSQEAHADIGAVDGSDAEEMAGVLSVVTAADLEAAGTPGVIHALSNPAYATDPDQPMLARHRVRYQGEPVAAVIAEDRYTAHEALDRITVEYEGRDAVVDPRDAVAGNEPTLHDETPDNVAFEYELGDAGAVDDAIADADHVVDLDLVNNRVSVVPMEPRGAIATYRGGELTVTMGSQNPHHHQQMLADTLGLRPGDVRVRAPDVGGGFGAKIHHYAGEALASWSAMQLGRPVQWVATRSESFLSDIHARDHRTTAEAAFAADGTFLGLRVDTVAAMGAYLSTHAASIAASTYSLNLSGAYDIPAIYAHVRGAWTNTAPVDAYRGAGRPEATYVTERVIQAAARELDLDPAAIRQRNFIPANAFPYEVATGHVYDSGDYDRALETALDLVEYDDLRERQREARENGRYIGVGISSFVFHANNGPNLFESGCVRFKPSGEVVVEAGTTEQGQGHATTFAQIVGDALGVPYDDVRVEEGDTAAVPEGSGTYGSRSAEVAGGAIVESAEKVIDRARRIAAHRLEADPDDVAFEDGEFAVRGAPGRSIHIQEVASAAYAADVPDGSEPGLEATTFFTPPDYSFPFGTYIAVVEVDPDTGEVSFERFVAVDDVGERLNPTIVEGQIHGGVAQGIGQARYEDAAYDDNGQLRAGSMMDYTVPKAEHIPDLETGATVTPGPRHPLGIKGVGEAGPIGAPPAVINAVLDALEPLGVDHIDMPITDERVWRAIRAAED